MMAGLFGMATWTLNYDNSYENGWSILFQGDKATMPTYLSVDRAGNLYVSETGAHSVRRIGPDGILGTIAGTGTRGGDGDGGPGPGAMLDTPQGIAVDSDGNVFIADSGNRRIRRVSAPSSCSRTPSACCP